MTYPANRPSSGSVVIFFYPDTACIELANRLASKTYCVVVDNTPGKYQVSNLAPEIKYIPNGDNVGVATALNQGIAELITAGCSSALLFDQDSQPADDLVALLPQLLIDLSQKDEHIAAIAPAYDDERLGGVAPFVRFRPFRLKRVPAVGAQALDVDFLITSGCCVNLACWKNIGPMDDTLFIDFVDLEWCIRAKRKGFRLLGIPWLTMPHQLGGEPVRVLGRPYPMHSPLRHYYLFRNAIALVLRPYVPWTWKSTELVKLPVRLLVYCLLPSQRMDHLSMAIRGLRDGLRGRLGRLSQ